MAHDTVNTGGYTMTQADPRFDPRGFTDGNPVPQGLDPNDPTHTVILTPTAHGFATGQQVVYDNGGGASITGLTNGSTYYVNVLSPTTFTLSMTARGPPITLGLPALLMGESHRLIPTSDAHVASDSSPRFIPAKDVSGSTITLPYAFSKKDSGGTLVATPIATGDALVYSSGGGTEIGGLSDGETYYAIVVGTGTYGAQQIRLASTHELAMARRARSPPPTPARRTHSRRRSRPAPASAGWRSRPPTRTPSTPSASAPGCRAASP